MDIIFWSKCLRKFAKKCFKPDYRMIKLEFITFIDDSGKFIQDQT